MSENYFVRLNNINVNDHKEKKNGLDYLSWAWAWGEVKKLHPEATYTIYETADGCFYHHDGKTCWVKTGVTINGIEHIEYLPVMNNRNQSIALKDVTSFDVNKAIQRSITKACARHGLGLYIYAGEDLPDEEDEQQVKPPQKPAPPPPQKPAQPQQAATTHDLADADMIEQIYALARPEDIEWFEKKYGSCMQFMPRNTAIKAIAKLKGEA